MNDDTISRQSAIDTLADMYCKSDEDGYIWIIRSDAWARIDALPSAQPDPKWRPIKTRPMDEEERQEWSEKLGYDIDYDEAVIYSNLPDDGEEVLICYKWGDVCKDTFRQEEEGCYFEDGGDMDGVIAWMPLPEPWKGEQDEQTD